MRYFGVARKVEVIQYASCGYHGCRKILHSKPLERSGGKLFLEALLGRLGGVDPVVELEDAAFVGEIGRAEVARAPHPQELLRLQMVEQTVGLLSGGLRA